MGWGAQCEGIRTGGPWSRTESLMHINCQELLAASLALKCFAKGNWIHLKMDNVTALTYINKFGGTASQELNRLTKDIWLWCLDRRITLHASHLAGVLNTVADKELWRMKDRTDWKLFPQIFSRINRRTGPLQVDLFASRLTHQLPDYISWKPDPGAMATDAFTVNWSVFRGYANPGCWRQIPSTSF